jgi:two-component system, NtrC family, sensor kinase
MRTLLHTPIKGRLTTITMLTSGVALLFACAAFVGYELLVFRDSTVEELSTTAAIIGNNSAAALSFNDPASARQTLRSLNTHPHVLGAALYDRNGKLFARYVHVLSANAFNPPQVEQPGHRFEDDRLKLFYRFDLAGEHAGTVYIESDLRELPARMRRYAVISGCVLLLSWTVAFLLAARLQQAISMPISHLSHVMNQVRAQNDYSLRASKHGEDELGDLIDGFNTMLDQIRTQDRALQEARDQLEGRVADRTCELQQQITEREQAQAELERTHRQLLEVSRQAGMAEVATNVLHNVGNVLNSLNVSATMLAEQVERSKASGLARLAGLLREHEHDLGYYLAHDPRGRYVPMYLSQLSEHVRHERDTNLKELASLRSNIDHIKEIVSTQQDYSKMSGVKELINPAALLEQAVRMNAGAFQRHPVQVLRQFEPVPPFSSEKHKVLQILINLLRNAKFACSESGRTDGQVILRVENGKNCVRIAVADNGVGIAPENMTRIFAHGFTTRREGHGFGLHSGALAARELGGSLQAFSDGLGRGATFVLELPLLKTFEVASA